MAVLVTRPAPDNAATVAALRERGIASLLAPMLRFEAVAAFEDAADYDGLIATSANALRAAADHPALAQWRTLPLFAVGEHTGEAARAIGFADVVAGRGGADALPPLVESYFARGARKTGQRPALLHLAGADIAHDLSAPLAARGIDVIVRTVYRMAAVSHLPREVCNAFAANQIDAILHFSRRSAQAFVAAVRSEGVEITALALPQCCLSDTIGAVLRGAGASRVIVTAAPNERAMLEAVDRALQPR